MRYCANCGQETGWPRYCGDCWRMVWKAAGAALVAEGVRYALRGWLGA